jgi:hypothetical protein
MRAEKHACPDWDFMIIHPMDPEILCCTCPEVKDDNEYNDCEWCVEGDGALEDGVCPKCNADWGEEGVDMPIARVEPIEFVESECAWCGDFVICDFGRCASCDDEYGVKHSGKRR